MKTTIDLSEPVRQALKREAAKQGKSMSYLTEAALRVFPMDKPVKRKLPPIPVFHGGGARVDVADRDALYDFMGDD